MNTEVPVFSGGSRNTLLGLLRPLLGSAMIHEAQRHFAVCSAPHAHIPHWDVLGPLCCHPSLGIPVGMFFISCIGCDHGYPLPHIHVGSMFRYSLVQQHKSACRGCRFFLKHPDSYGFCFRTGNQHLGIPFLRVDGKDESADHRYDECYRIQIWQLASSRIRASGCLCAP